MNNRIQKFYKEYRELYEDDYDNLSSYEVWMEVGQLTLKYELTSDDVKYILDNMDTSFDYANNLKDTLDNWDGSYEPHKISVSDAKKIAISLVNKALSNEMNRIVSSINGYRFIDEFDFDKEFDNLLSELS